MREPCGNGLDDFDRRARADFDRFAVKSAHKYSGNRGIHERLQYSRDIDTLGCEPCCPFDLLAQMFGVLPRCDLQERGVP